MKTDNTKGKFCPPLRDEFTKYGDRFVKIAHNPANGMYCYRRTISDGSTYYEVFKAPKAKDGRGGTYEYYPTSAQFGFGTALCIRGDTFAELRDRIAKARERLGKLVKQQPRGTGGRAPAVRSAAPPIGSKYAKVKKPVTIPSTQEVADRVRAGMPFGNMTIASTTPPEDKPAPRGTQHVRMSDPRGVRFVGISHLPQNA